MLIRLAILIAENRVNLEYLDTLQDLTKIDRGKKLQSIFISYSHADSSFADRLAQDLRESDVPAIYDKWLLRVGDSIIEKISSTVSAADKIVAILSPTSVKSQWVKKELAIAMTREINKRRVTVLPALLKDCNVPPILSDKFYADFRHSYYKGLRQILEALSPSSYSWEPHLRREKLENAGSELRKLLQLNDIELIRSWFLAHPNVPAALFGHGWSVCQAIPKFRIGNEVADFLVISGQSFRYYASIVILGDPMLTNMGKDALVSKAQQIQGLLTWCHEHEDAVRRSIALRLASSYGADQIASGSGMDIDAKLLCGRRAEYSESENHLRTEIYISNKAVEVVSYDRALEALGKVQKRPKALDSVRG